MVSELLDSRNVVVRAPNALGDLVMATPAFARLAAHFGAERLTLVSPPIGAALLVGNTWFREIIPLDRKGRHRGLIGSARFARTLRQKKFDLGIVFPNSFSSAWLFWQGRVKRRVGYFKDARKFLLHTGRERDHDTQGSFVPKYTGQYFMELLDVMGLPEAPLKPTLPVSDTEREKADEFLRRIGVGGKPLVICAPGGAYGPSKLWPFERYAHVLKGLEEDGAGVLISRAPDEAAQARAVMDAAGREWPTNEALDLGTLKAVYERASLLLTNDTGPRHIAVALGLRVVCIMGPNDPRYTATEFEHGEVIREPVDCTPYTWPCQLKECPIDHRCMTAIEVGRVLDACRRQLAGAETRPGGAA